MWGHITPLHTLVQIVLKKKLKLSSAPYRRFRGSKLQSHLLRKLLKKNINFLPRDEQSLTPFRGYSHQLSTNLFNATSEPRVPGFGLHYPTTSTWVRFVWNLLWDRTSLPTNYRFASYMTLSPLPSHEVGMRYVTQLLSTYY